MQIDVSQLSTKEVVSKPKYTNEIFQYYCHRDIERCEHASLGQIFTIIHSRYSYLGPIICRNMGCRTAGFLLCVVIYHVKQIQGNTGKSYTPFLSFDNVSSVTFIYI